MAFIIFAIFVAFVLGISFFTARRAKSVHGYFAAGGQIHWSVNGISFAGDYLSAASFLGICGMIATVGYDGFLYSIGYLAGWIVALFIVAEPMKRLGKYTFTDALDSKFDSRAIKLFAAISTLIVSICYLIPQMVGAGVLVEPLLGIPHWVGVIMVGAIVIIIVATAGMASTTYVQFLKGTLLIIFSIILTIAVCYRGLSTEPDQGGTVGFYEYSTLTASADLVPHDTSFKLQHIEKLKDVTLVKLLINGRESWWKSEVTSNTVMLKETQWLIKNEDGTTIINGNPASKRNQLRQVGNLEAIKGKTGKKADTGSLNPFAFIAAIGDKDSVIKRWQPAKFSNNGEEVTVYYPVSTPGNKIMRPGLKFKVEGTPWERIDFASLMLALFFGTAALPHILIRYYTVPSSACARKSTIVAIAAIGLFYVLTMFMGLGAMVNNVVNRQHVRAASRKIVRHVPVCCNLCNRVRHRPWNSQRTYRRGIRRSGPRPP